MKIEVKYFASIREATGLTDGCEVAFFPPVTGG
jgi:molybdopterin converting factor small subunit